MIVAPLMTPILGIVLALTASVQRTLEGGETDRIALGQA